MFLQVITVSGLVKLDVEDEVDSSRKFWHYLLHEVDAIGLFNEEIVIALVVGNPLLPRLTSGPSGRIVRRSVPGWKVAVISSSVTGSKRILDPGTSS